MRNVSVISRLLGAMADIPDEPPAVTEEVKQSLRNFQSLWDSATSEERQAALSLSRQDPGRRR